VLLALFGAFVAAVFLYATLGPPIRRKLLSAFLLEYFGAMVKVRLPMTQGIGSCSKMLSRESRSDLSDVEQNLAEGMLIGDALANVPRRKKSLLGRLIQKLEAWRPFPQSRLISAAEAETLRIGEMSGDLAGAFNLVLQERRRYEEIRTWMIGAALYPVYVLLFGAGVPFVIFTFIIPKFRQIFTELDLTLPPMTQMTVQAAGFLRDELPSLLLLLALAVLLVRWLWRTRPLRRRRAPLRELMFRLPDWVAYHIRPLRRAMQAEFCTELAMLVRVGSPPHRALRVLADGTMNSWFRDRIRKAADLCEKGDPLPTALEKSGLDPRVAWFGRAADDPAELAESLGQLAEDYRSRVSWGVTLAGRLLPPLTILGFGWVVAFVVISLFLPLVKLAMSLGGG
jgi:type IV pilus assembly protein PilC